MKFSRMIIINTEANEDDYYYPTFIYRVTTPFEHNENLPANQFAVKSIELLDNGWVYVESHDDVPGEAIAPWRVTALEDRRDD